jgi:hypothetical protein
MVNRPTGKRVPCPKCDSKSQYHDGYKSGVYYPVHCHACGYSPSKEAKEAKAEQATAMPIGAALCDCGKPLKTANERKTNTCHACSGELNLNFQGDNWPDESAAADDHTATCDCGNPLKTKYQVKIKKCFYCQVTAAISAKADRSAHALGSFAYSERKGLNGLLLAESGAVVTELWKRPMLAIPLNDGAANGYQLIDGKGNKKFAFPNVKSTADNAFFHTFIGNRESASIKIKCEGYATGLSIAMARPDVCVLICSTADNLIKAAKVYGAEFGIIATDNDKSHAGIVKATAAAKIDGSKIWYCPVDSDFNDLHCQQGLQAVSDSFERDIYGAASLHLLAVKHGAGYQQTDSPLNELPISEGFTILSAAMGSGKSRLFFPNVKALGNSCLAIAHLKSLVSGLADVLGCENYEKTDKLVDYLALCINSITKYERAYEVVLIDEFHAVLDFLAFGKTEKDKKRIRIYECFKRILATAKYIVFASATMRPEHVEVVIKIAKELSKPITIIDHQARPKKKLVILNYGDFTTKRDNAIADKRNIFGFSLSKDDVIAYNDKLQNEGIKAIAIHSGDNGQNMEVITSGDYVNYQAVNGSPSVLAGVHMVGHFDDVFCDLSSKTEISPLSALQAPGRVRTADVIYTTLQGGKDKLSESAYADTATILQAKRNSLLSSLRENYHGLGYADDEIEAMLESHMARPFTDYDHMSAALKKAHDDEFMAWNNNFLSYAAGLGYEIEDLRHDKSADDKEARRARSEGIKEVKVARYADIAAISLLDFGDIEMLRDKADKTEREQHAIIHADCLATFESATAETVQNVLENDLHNLAANYALARSEGYASQRLIDDMAAIGEGQKSAANTKNLAAKREVLAALLAVSGVTVEFDNGKAETQPTGRYNFEGAAIITAETDFSQVFELIKKHKFTLGFSRYTTLSHKTVLRLLREWLGFEISSNRIHGGEYHWQVVGLADNLVAIGGAAKLRKYEASLAKQLANEDGYFSCNSFSLKESIYTKSNAADDVQPLALSAELKAEAWLGCAHHWHWHWADGAPKCDNCGQTFEQWHGFNQDRLIEVLQESGDSLASYAKLLKVVIHETV